MTSQMADRRGPPRHAYFEIKKSEGGRDIVEEVVPRI